MSSNWKQIIEQRRDANLGAMLIRMAHQATQLHLRQTARDDRTSQGAGGTGPRSQNLAASSQQGGVR